MCRRSNNNANRTSQIAFTSCVKDRRKQNFVYVFVNDILTGACVEDLRSYLVYTSHIM